MSDIKPGTKFIAPTREQWLAAGASPPEFSNELEFRDCVISEDMQKMAGQTLTATDRLDLSDWYYVKENRWVWPVQACLDIGWDAELAKGLNPRQNDNSNLSSEQKGKPPMTKAQYMEFFSETVERMKAVTKAKNEDYTGSGDDPFANFTRVEALGICSTEQGFLTRMTDKLCRITSFVQRGTLSVKDESVTDTLQDLAVYSILFMAYLKSKKGEAK